MKKETKKSLENIIRNYCEENDMSLTVLYNMPQESETSLCMYEPTQKNLYLDDEKLSAASHTQQLFFVYRQLRKALQYQRADLFDNVIRESRFYAIKADGTCCRLVHTRWKKCVLPGGENYFHDVYLGQPYELDATEFAYKAVLLMERSSPELDSLHETWTPRRSVPAMEYRILYNKIEEKAV